MLSVKHWQGGSQMWGLKNIVLDSLLIIHATNLNLSILIIF